MNKVYMKSLLTFVIIATLISGCRVVVDRPVRPDVILIPASPGPGYIYINDSWRWNQRAHSYRVSKGYWAKPKKSSVWVDGHWRKTRGGWRYAKGHWS
jgi:hypothetical protein